MKPTSPCSSSSAAVPYVIGGYNAPFPPRAGAFRLPDVLSKIG